MQYRTIRSTQVIKLQNYRLNVLRVCSVRARARVASGTVKEAFCHLMIANMRVENRNMYCVCALRCAFADQQSLVMASYFIYANKQLNWR